ncbi:MAG: type IX secretion system sortase PorU [Bacteroidia bacterium]|nr:type IX secretion system sortase PorU [Bacteroidia bacterium]
MNKLLLFAVLILHSYGFSQQKTFTINWENSRVLATESSSIEVPAFNAENFSFSYERGLKFISEWDERIKVDESSVVISNVSTSAISEQELKQLNVKSIPSDIKLKLRNSTARGKTKLMVEFSPIIIENGVYKKVNQVSISYRQDNNRNSRNTLAISNSVLSQGNWYRFYVDTTGVFKLTKSFLNSIGVSSNVDPRNVKIYGQGGQMLPLENSVSYPFDLTENAIQFVGEEDGVLNNNDFILFYAEGPQGFNAESNTYKNIFTDRAYYFVNVSAGNGKRIQAYQEPVGDSTESIVSFHELKFYEVDDFNLARLGRRWFGDRFDFENMRSYEFDFPRMITTEPIRLKVYAAAAGEISTTMSVTMNGNMIDTFFFDGIEDPILGDDDFFNNDVISNSSTISIDLTYDNGGNPSSLGYLDYISVEALSNLTHDGEQFLFKNNDVAAMSGIAEYTVTNANNISQIWEVTDKYNVTSLENVEGESTISFKSELGTSRSFMAVDPSDYYEPKRDSNTTVLNQNIKGTIFLNDQGQFQNLDYLIVAREDMLDQAERLAQINRDVNGLMVKVIPLQQIYNEFSSGNQDVSAIRNLVRYIYDNVADPEDKIKYVCLFGDGSYDYKDRISNNTNVVPSWHSLNSFSLSSSFVSDDFIGMMDENEGTMQSSDKLDIAMGRILADTPQRAKELVDKIKDYYASESYGSWRNNFITISDDVDQSWETILQGTTDDIGDTVTGDKPFINVTKIHSDAFQQESTAGGQRYPDVNKAIFDAMEIGALVVNYFGHGGEDGLARERIWDKNNVQELNNVCKLPCFVTVTCEYTKFDNPNRPTAGEFLFWNKEAGAISLITTTRQIFVSVGVAFNIVLEEYLFALGSNDYPSMAEALRLTKNDPTISSIEQRRLVFFIGDPAMNLAFPKPNIRLTEINDVPIDQETDVLQALSYAKIKGEVVDEMGNLLDNYNGVLTATIYDKEIDRSTLGNDGTTESGELIILDFKTLGEIIFRGQATIQNGVFDFDFIVPRDISIPEGNGKISFYAKTETPLQDQAGSSFEIKIGGLNVNAPEDAEGPNIALFMNDENFVSGGITNQSPTLLAKLTDTNGINTASGIGHDIVAILDGDETNPFKLNAYYLANVDDYTKGTVTYPFRDLEPGLHTISLKAWDVYNNSSTSEIQFVVYDEKEDLVIRNLLNYPNPFINYTEFWFNHNSSEVLDVSIQIFTISGKLVKTINGKTTGGSKVTSSLSKDIVWDGRDDFGEKIGKGVYVYKLTVRSPLGNKTVEKFQKLVIL